MPQSQTNSISLRAIDNLIERNATNKHRVTELRIVRALIEHYRVNGYPMARNVEC
jgi:hypothetical protein